MTAYQPPTALPRDILRREDMRSAIAAHDFGVVFRIARSEAGISYSKIAAECDMKPERVGALARGEGRVSTFSKIAQIADAFRIPGHMLGLVPRDWETSEPSVATASARAISTQRDGGSVRRREFFKASAGVGLAVGLSDLEPVEIGQRIGKKIPEQLRMRTARLRRLDDVLGGGDTYRVYIGEFQATKSLIRDGSYSEETRRALLSVLAEQAQQAGWAAFDGGKHAVARGLYEDSHTAALEAGDSALAGNALAFLAYQASNGDRLAGVKIAEQSCRIAGPDAPAGVRALLYERLAWAYAVAGNASETERALKAAEVALSEKDENPQPDWVAWVDSDELQIMTGRCWTELRRPLRAVPALEQALSRYDETHARDKSLYLSWLADSYLASGEIEQAAVVTGRALELSVGVASVRPRERMAPVIQKLSAHRSLPAVAEVLEMMHS
ncbi:tetratricopeptide repeat protein [Streptomyces fulvoviolaceus]|uniref:XRE family transcriptional regulator n=1 Tax=Streptomyces fulvoviolaceus TaxID=285535 RepID=UPI0021C1FA92|nr:XRE family transcriptional regulator [Streptomyces fulvoviolaceus]MCT9077187.1 XRE family transcriptional regulator [Streptomyces fulvoviolaceus]